MKRQDESAAVPKISIVKLHRPTPQANDKPDVPTLRSLGPAYDEKLHGRHAAVLLQVLTDSSANPAKNIALAGHYGSGKSSVILGVQGELTARKVDWVNLSLSSLGIDQTQRARVRDDGTVAPLTNLIQKEIVKQLLYRKAPSDMPGSRYFRIDAFRPRAAVVWASAVAIAFFVISVLLGLVDRVRKVGPPHLVTREDWIPWVIVAVLGLFLGGVWFIALRALQSRVRVESVSAGGAAVQLSTKENSYFDEYLDEIVYFFQKTQTQVAIFEDLDRFKDPHIFETLRELNTVLNNSEQIKSRPVRFVYAVRDSIFEQLEDPIQEAADAPLAVRASALETAPSANRTKFFDLVVPMVPFITHRSARDLVAAEFTESDYEPSAALVNLVGVHLTDMRLIRNIRNEFEIYRTSVLGKNGLKGLTADRLFAIMVYKNLHLEDFEAIRLGTSKIDDAHSAFRDMVNHQISTQAARSKSANDALAKGAEWNVHASAAGQRLAEVLTLVHRASRIGGNPVLQYSGENYAMSDLSSADFWKALFDTHEAAMLYVPSMGRGTTFAFDELLTLAGPGAKRLEESVQAAQERLRRTSRLAAETKEFVSRATMEQLLARSDLTMPNGAGQERNLDSIVADLVSPLAHELLAHGYIDENFTLYCSDYHAIAISVSAMNFILHCVQPDVSDYRFRFDGHESIEVVEKEMGTRFTDGQSIFNLDVFDHYLAENPTRLQSALKRIAVQVATDTTFVDAYLVDGNQAEKLVGELASRWEGLFIHLIEAAPTDAGRTLQMVDHAVRVAEVEIDFETSDEVIMYFGDNYRKMQAFTGPMVAGVATNVAILAEKLSLRFTDLIDLGGSQLQAIVGASLYPVTRANLDAALGAGSEVSLDSIRDKTAIYNHVLSNLEDYLGALADNEHSVNDADQFNSVLADVISTNNQYTEAVARAASENCSVDDLEQLDPAGWNAVATAGTLQPTVWNASQFVATFGVTDPIAHFIARHDLVDANDVEAASRLNLAHSLCEAENLDDGQLVKVLDALDLPDGLDLESLGVNGLKHTPVLLKAGLIPDSAEMYRRIADRPFAFREQYLAASDEVADYIDEIPLSAEDLTQVMKSRQIPTAVKKAIVGKVDYVRARLSRSGAIAICQWAQSGQNITVELLSELAAHGAPAEHVLGLLESHLPAIDLSDLDNILTELGDEYEPLTRRGRHHPKVKNRTGTEALLRELQKRSRVSSYSPTLMATFTGGAFKVNMRQ